MFRHFTLTTDHTTLVTHFNLKEVAELSPRYNIAPFDQIATVSASMDLPPRDIRFLDWGLILNDKDVESAEDRVVTVDDNELSSVRFNASFRFKRCLILADGLYFWKKADDVPKYFVRADRQPFALAGIREQFKSGDSSFNTCAIITLSSNESGKSEQAMPAVILPQDFDQWLSPMVTKIQRIGKLISPLPLGEMESRAVGDQVKDVADKLAHCIDPRK